MTQLARDFLINKFEQYEKNGSWDNIYQRLLAKSNRQERSLKLTCKAARSIQNARKNRYRDAAPWDHSRIHLHDVPEDESDYINASYVTVPGTERRYILSQGPLENTCHAFWLMCWQMGSKKETSTEKREDVVRMHQNGQKQTFIARSLGLSKSTVSKILKRYARTGSANAHKHTGRHRKTKKRDDLRMKILSKADPNKSSIEIYADLPHKVRKEISSKTVQRRLREFGLFGRRPAHKPLISAKNRKLRVKFAEEHRYWTAQQWSLCLFSDESKFELFGSDGIRYVRRPINERFGKRYVIPTLKHGGGSVLVWGGFSAYGMIPLKRIDGNMDRHVYLDILSKHMLPNALQLMPSNFLFQQDNDPKHTSRLVKDWFQKEGINLMEWPSQNPDLNPIEHLWEALKRGCKGVKWYTLNEKFELLAKKWMKIPTTTIDNLIASMSARCQAVIDFKGFPTKY